MLISIFDKFPKIKQNIILFFSIINIQYLCYFDTVYFFLVLFLIFIDLNKDFFQKDRIEKKYEIRKIQINELLSI